MSKKILITGCAGFIGFHLSNLLLKCGYHVIGVDALTDYYDPNLKKARLNILLKRREFIFYKIKIENFENLSEVFDQNQPEIVIHLAAQAGVRYSIEFPFEYVNTNLVGTFNVLESSKRNNVFHLLMASTSSVYGSNEFMPFTETQKTDTPLSFYAATKKSNEIMAHSYSHIFKLPITMLRFFTVYGPWGRPDMALFKFTDAIKKNQPINVYNYGKMKRDFTFVEDLVISIERLISRVPPQTEGRLSTHISSIDSLSPVAPHRVINIGNSKPAELMDYISALEHALGKKAKKNMMPIQMGDVPETWADTKLLNEMIGYVPSTPVEIGVKAFAEWYETYTASLQNGIK